MSSDVVVAADHIQLPGGRTIQVGPVPVPRIVVEVAYVSYLDRVVAGYPSIAGRLIGRYAAGLGTVQDLTWLQAELGDDFVDVDTVERTFQELAADYTYGLEVLRRHQAGNRPATGPSPDAAPFVHAGDCSHPQPIVTCGCGRNAACMTCGWGRGSSPCDCHRPQASPPLNPTGTTPDDNGDPSDAHHR